MSLVELTIVIGVLGIIFAAVFLFFTKGIQQFHFNRRQNELAIAGRLALEQISDEVIWAGYLPVPGIPGDEWHPIQSAMQESFTFYADFGRNGVLDDSDYRNIFLGDDNVIRITDNASMSRNVGYNITELRFEYLNANGNVFSQPLTPSDLDAVRHVRVGLTLQDSYMGNLYQTFVRTTISPRNLGLNRNIDPSFLPPPPLSGIVAVNVTGTADEKTPTESQYSLMQNLVYLGLTVVPLADDELLGYAYEDNGVNLVILRNVLDGDGWHSFITDSLHCVPCPVICLDADDAANLFGMGSGPMTVVTAHQASKIVSSHPVYNSIPFGDPDSLNFTVYVSLDSMNVLSSLSDNTTGVTSIYNQTSAFLVCVRNEELPTRRILFGIPKTQNLDTPDGVRFFRNVLNWAMGGVEEVDPGEPITEVEGFEDEAGQVRRITLWQDSLNNPAYGLDSIPLMADDFSGPVGLSWTLASLGGGQVTVADGTLRMHRPFMGAETRNLAMVTLPLGGYDIWTDSLYLKVEALPGTGESIDSNDGVFFVSVNSPGDTTYNRFAAPASGPSWNTVRVNLNQAAQGCGITFTDDFQVALSQSGTGPWDYYGISWDDFEVGRVAMNLSEPGWKHGPYGGVDDWSVRQNPNNPSDYMWALHANPPAGVYSNNAGCYLQTPSFTIPEQGVDPTLSFRHFFDMEASGVPNDYGFLQVSVSGGPWNDVPQGEWISSGYNYNTAGRGVFSGSSTSWHTETLDLKSWAGESVRFRFVFRSNSSGVSEGWYLDDFVAECTVQGYELTSVAFKTSSAADHTFQKVDIYLGATDSLEFESGGFWDIGELVHVFSDSVRVSSASDWQTITLPDNSYFHTPGANLVVKIITWNPTLEPAVRFEQEDLDDMCRAAWGSSLPGFLQLQSTRPATRFVIDGKEVTTSEESATPSQYIPMSVLNPYSAFEAIYTSEELGLGSGVTWSSGGANNDWEIGAPMFFPDVDPALIPENGAKVAGNALTQNMGYHAPEAWSWLASSGFSMEEASDYDSVFVRYMRCVRLPMSSNAHVQLAFGDDPDLTPSGGAWTTVREYNGVHHQYWDYETIDVTTLFEDNSDYDYFFIRFLLDSGTYGEAGGWNLDNIQFFGR